MNYTLSGATASVAGYGSWDRIFFSNGNWQVGAYWTIAVGSTQGPVTLGVGFLGITPSYTCSLVLGQRVYVSNGTQFNFSGIDVPTGWNEQDIGAGYISYTSQYGRQDTVMGLASFQGKLAVLGRYSIQIWQYDADPNNFSLQQQLINIGTVAPNSIQSQGDLDVLFLDDTGIRSLRSREVTLNAYVEDVGTPIDNTVQGVLSLLTTAQKSAACAIIEPSTKRYWLTLNGTIYVLSLFRSSKIIAWSTYKPTFPVVETPQEIPNPAEEQTLQDENAQDILSEDNQPIVVNN